MTPKSKILKGMYSLLFLVILFYSINALWVGVTNYYRSKETPPTPGVEFKLSEAEIRELTTLAEKGNVTAMSKLANYYGIYDDSPETLDDYEYWLKKIIEAAKAGNLEARKIYPSWQKTEGNEN